MSSSEEISNFVQGSFPFPNVSKVSSSSVDNTSNPKKGESNQLPSSVVSSVSSKIPYITDTTTKHPPIPPQNHPPPKFPRKYLRFLLCSENLEGQQSCSKVESRTGPGDEFREALQNRAALSVPCSSSEQILAGSCSEVVRGGSAEGVCKTTKNNCLT